MKTASEIAARLVEMRADRDAEFDQARETGSWVHHDRIAAEIRALEWVMAKGGCDDEQAD